MKRARAWDAKEAWEEMRLKVKSQDEVCRDMLDLVGRKDTQERVEAEWCAIEQSPTVQREIRLLLDLIRSENQSWREDADRTKLLETLSSDCEYERGKNSNPRIVAGTCEWFFNDNLFKKW